MRVQHPGIDKYGTRSGSDGVSASQELNIQGSTNTEPGAVATGCVLVKTSTSRTDKYGTRSGSDGVCASQELNIQGSTKLPIDTRLMSLEPGRYRDCVKTLRQFWRWVFDA